jgi:cytochrome P450
MGSSDTTAATLTWLLYELCKNPTVQTKLRNTVDQIKPEKAFLDAEDLTNCPYLDAVINETLRLHPAVSGSRMTDGLTMRLNHF